MNYSDMDLEGFGPAPIRSIDFVVSADSPNPSLTSPIPLSETSSSPLGSLAACLGHQEMVAMFQPLWVDTDEKIHPSSSDMQPDIMNCTSDQDVITQGTRSCMGKQEEKEAPKERFQQRSSIISLESNFSNIISIPGDQWDTRYPELVQFVQLHGHAIVPNGYPANKQLAKFVKQQRYQYKLRVSGQHTSMSDERFEALDELGFVWQSHDATWMERYHDLLGFRAQHGHSRVPTKYPQNPQLAIWVKCQRRQFKLFLHGEKSHMTVDRAKMLAEADFVFNPRNLKDGMELTKEQVLFLESLQQQSP